MVWRNCGLCWVYPYARCSDCPGRDTLEIPNKIEPKMETPKSPEDVAVILQQIRREFDTFGRPSDTHALWLFSYVQEREADLAQIEILKTDLHESAECMRRHTGCLICDQSRVLAEHRARRGLDLQYRSPREVRCPWCHVNPSRDCRDRSGKIMEDYHLMRIELRGRTVEA